uniref:VWFD domain-containing protein n=1 Tax=Strigamia maritima TaxID=126957 RepID=T1IQL4_STRMM
MVFLKFLILFVVNYFTNLTYGQMEIEKKSIEAALQHMKTQLNQPLIPDGISTEASKYQTNVWNEPPQDFYHPHSSFNVYAGHKTELYISMLYEDNYEYFRHEQAVDMLLINEFETKILVAATPNNIFVNGIVPSTLYNDFDIPNVISMDYLKYTNFQTGQNEIYLIALQSLQHFQYILVFKFNFVTLEMEPQSALKIQPYVAKIRVISVPTAQKNLVFAVRYNDIRKMTGCSSTVYELSFHGPNLVLSDLQSLRTSGAVDAESFTINGVTYLVVANSFCLSSDVFVFDADVNGFYLYQRLALHNATNFHYFQMGFRHFVAAIGIQDALIFEWKIDNLVAVQYFPTPSSPVRQWHRQWQSLELPWKNEAVLLLVSSPEIQIIKWSKLKEKFVSEIAPICTEFLKIPNLMRVGYQKAIYSYSDFNVAKLNCILSREGCVGVSQLEENGVVKYILESVHQNLIPIENGGYNFWFKTHGVGFSCLIANTQIITPKVLSYAYQGVVYVMAPFIDETRTFVIQIHPSKILDRSSPTSDLHHLTKSEEILKTFETKLDDQYAKKIPSNVVTEKTEQTIYRPISFNTVTAFELINLDVFKFDFQDGEPNLRVWDEKFLILNKIIEKFHKFLDDAVDLRNEIVRIPNNIHFTELKVEENVFLIQKAEINRINNVPIINFMNSVVTWDQSEPIHGKKIFITPITHIGNIQVINLIADHRFPNDILTTSTEQTLNGEWSFNSPVEIDQIQVEVLNGINMTQMEMVSSLHYEETIIHHAPKTFMDRVEIHGDIIIDQIDGFDLRRLVEHAVTRTGTENQLITGKKIFMKNLNVVHNLNVAETVNGFDIPRLNKDIVKPYEPAVITAPKIFAQTVLANKNIHVRGFINYEKFPSNFVIQNSKVSISATKEFTAPLTVNGNLSVTGLINGLRVESAVTLYTPQSLYDHKIFLDKIDVQSLEVTGTIDGMRMEDLYRIAEDGRNLPDAPDYFKSLNISGNLENVRSINGHSVAELLLDVVYKGDQNVIFTDEKVFLKATRITGAVKNLEIINKLNLQTDFLNLQHPQNVIGRKTFTRRTTFHDIQVDGLIDQVNLTQFRKTAVTLNTTQEIHGILHFVNGITVRNIVVDGTIDNVSIPQDVLLKSESKIIHAPKLFLHGIRSNVVTTNNLDFNGRINSMDWRKFVNERVTLSTPQDIFSTITFFDQVEIAENLHVINKINDIDVYKLTEDAMMKSKPQNVTGIKTISGKVTADYIFTGSFGRISKVNLTELNTSIIRIHNNSISQKVYFDKVRVMERTLLEGKINKVFLNEIIEDSVLKSSDTVQNITGMKIFSETIKIDGDLFVITVNGLNPLTDILLKSTPQTIPGQFDLKTVIVNSDVIISGKINGIDLVQFEKQVMKTNEDLTLSTLTLENDLYIENDLQITGTINEIVFSDLIENSVLKNSDIQIESYKEFVGTLQVFGNVAVGGTVNDIKLNEFVKNIVLISEAQEITGIKTFTSDIETTSSIKISGNLTIRGTVNTINLNHLLTSTFYPNLPHAITGEKIFKRPIIIQDNVVYKTTINQIKLPIDVVLNNGNQPITATKRFEHIIVEGDVHGELVNGYILEDLYRDTVLNKHPKPITGVKILNKTVRFKSEVTVIGHVCNLDFGTNVMTTDKPQTITGVKTFHRMNIEDVIIHNINGQVFNVFDTLWTTLQSPIEASYEFLGETRIVNLTPEIEEIVLPSVSEEMKNLSQFLVQLKLGTNEVVEVCQVLDELAAPSIQAPEKLVYFKLAYETDLIGDGGFEIIQYQQHVYLILRQRNTPCEPHDVYLWNPETQFQKINAGIAKGRSVRWRTFVHKNEQFIVSVQPQQKLSCGTPSRIFRINKNTAYFDNYCTLKNLWFTEVAIIYDHDTLYVATIPYFNIFKLDLTHKSEFCKIEKYTHSAKIGNFLITLKLHKLFVVGDSNGIEIFEASLKPTASYMTMPGIQHLISATANGKEFLIVSRMLYETNSQIIQVYEFEFTKSRFGLLLLKQTNPTDRPILDIRPFAWGSNGEVHLAVLYKKMGISIMKLEGYGAFDEIKLPVTSAERLNIFTWGKRPYLLVAPIRRKREIQIFSGIIEGKYIF